MNGDDSPQSNHDSSEGEQWGRDEIYPEIGVFFNVNPGFRSS